jgi:hypothetical protein
MLPSFTQNVRHSIGRLACVSFYHDLASDSTPSGSLGVFGNRGDRAFLGVAIEEQMTDQAR